MPEGHLSKVPYPSGSDAPAAAADMMAIITALDAKLVLPAQDEADRDAKYADAPASTLVVSGPARTIWLKTGPGPTEWLTIFHDTGWVSTGFTALDGWEITTVKARNRNGAVNLRCQLLRTGDTITASSVGHLPDQPLITVPPQFRPADGDLDIVGNGRGFTTSGAVQLYAFGELRLLDLLPGSSITQGDYLRCSIGFLEG